MDEIDVFPVLDDAKVRPTLKPGDFDATETLRRIEDVIDLYKSFRREGDNLSPGVLSGSTTPRSNVLDELGFSALFRLAALWHDVKRSRAPDGTDTNARLAERQERLWQGFYNWVQDYLQERWVQQYRLVQAGGCLSYRRLFGKHSRVGYQNYRYEDDYPPCSDHTTLWCLKGRPPRFAEVLVTQPYSYRLDEMVAFAKEQGLWFWVSERPAWHYPRALFFIEWANPESQFAALRGTQEADLCVRTIHAWKGEELLPGPGTVFALKHPTTIKRWRDGLDLNSLTRKELTRLIRLNDEGATCVTH